MIAYLCYPDELGRRVHPDNLHPRLFSFVTVSGELLNLPKCQGVPHMQYA